ncbi:MAG: copper amine oxidase N-terminal domain-containing protein [Clostridia bacterium]|nr:copper amine oxidase N-terminal domain-containing protein [Clostridia bacterium]
MKKIIVSLMLLITLFSTTVNAQIKLSVNNEEINFKGDEPTLINDRTYVPVRFLAEALGAEVDWDDTHKVVIIKNYGIDGKQTHSIHYLRLGENKMVIAQYYYGENNGANSVASYYFPDDIYPIIVNDRTMLPFRYVAELLGAQVYYNPTAGIAHCVKRDFSNGSYKGKDDEIWTFPILSTVIGDYFADELNKWYSDPNNGWARNFKYNTPTYWDGTLADTTVWAGIDHVMHPEWYEWDGQGNSPTAHKFTGNLENEKGCYAPFYRTYLPNEPLRRGAYGENQVQSRNLGSYGGENYDKSYNEYLNLTKNWGININTDKSGLDNFKLGGIYGKCHIRVIDEEMYRQISKDVIHVWAGSPGHLSNLLRACSYNWANGIGFAIVGENAYYNLFY